MGHQNISRAERAGDDDGHRAHTGTQDAASQGKRGTTALPRRERRPSCGHDEPLETDRAPEAGGPEAPGARERFDTLIVQQWTKSLKGPFDWGDWPLARYTIGSGVLRSATLDSDAAVRRLAWVCAMVACGRAPQLRGLDPRPLLDRDGRQLERSDGARGWRCNLRRAKPDGSRLQYWVHPSGLIELDAVVGAEVGPGQPGADAEQPEVSRQESCASGEQPCGVSGEKPCRE
jgi:hypothetical protein